MKTMSICMCVQSSHFLSSTSCLMYSLFASTATYTFVVFCYARHTKNYTRSMKSCGPTGPQSLSRSVAYDTRGTLYMQLPRRQVLELIPFFVRENWNILNKTLKFKLNEQNNNCKMHVRRVHK